MQGSAEHTFCMRHQDSEPAIGRGNRANARGRAIWVEGIIFRYATMVIDIAQCDERLVQVASLGKIRAPFAMGNHNGRARTRHSLEEDGR